MPSTTAKKKWPILRKFRNPLQTRHSTYALNIVSRRRSFRCGLTTSWLTIAHCAVRVRSTGIHFEWTSGRLKPSVYRRVTTASWFGCIPRLTSTNSQHLSWGVSPKTIRKSCRSTLNAREKRCAWHYADRRNLNSDLDGAIPERKVSHAACAHLSV